MQAKQRIIKITPFTIDCPLRIPLSTALPACAVESSSPIRFLLQGQLNATWTSPDGATSITRNFRDGSDALKVVIAGVLDIAIVTSREEELIADPPIHFLDFFINSMRVGPSVHRVRTASLTQGILDLYPS
jgi:hypothetical protein